MAWIEVHQAIVRHGKTTMLAEELAVSRAQAIGHLISFWTWAVDSCGRTGDLSRYSARVIAEGAGWDSAAFSEDALPSAPMFISALVRCGWIDFSGQVPSDGPIGGSAAIHDWEQYVGRYFDLIEMGDHEREKKREKWREQKRNQRCPQNVRADSPRPVHAMSVNVRPPTVPNLTVPNRIQRSKPGPQAAGPASAAPAGQETTQEPRQGPEDAVKALEGCQRLKLPPGAILMAWAKAFPDVNLAGEIAKADAWAVANKVTRSPKGWARTMQTWLGKEQDRARGGMKKPQERKYAGIAEKL